MFISLIPLAKLQIDFAWPYVGSNESHSGYCYSAKCVVDYNKTIALILPDHASSLYSMAQERIKERERVTYASATVRAKSKTTTINRTILENAHYTVYLHAQWNVITRGQFYL